MPRGSSRSLARPVRRPPARRLRPGPGPHRGGGGSPARGTGWEVGRPVSTPSTTPGPGRVRWARASFLLLLLAVALERGAVALGLQPALDRAARGTAGPTL